MHYAKAEDLREYLNLTAIRGEVVELNFGGQDKATTPIVLERMF